MAKSSFKKFVERELGQIPHFLVYALLEWFLIAVLFIDGLLAFLANEFAEFFDLKTPCLLCTRLDHVLVRRNPDFYYNDSICDSHKKSLSNFAYCHAHKKLTEIKRMCEVCLLSFATEKETDCETYKSLLGILHKDLELLLDDSRDFQASFPAPSAAAGKKDGAVVSERRHGGGGGDGRCACCGELLKVRSSSTAKRRGAATQAPVPSPQTSFDGRNLDLPHVKYAELKYSDTEPEMPEDDESAGRTTRAREDLKAASVPLLKNPEGAHEDRTPNMNIVQASRFFGIPLSDSAQNSPRWSVRTIRKPFQERTENNALEVADSNTYHEVPEGDSIVQNLKRQVRLDRKSLMALYMELDEERSASAEAANNAMAMITKLQAEKAAVQMEALQYQRMMEEQAEYDQEALQTMKDQLAKRDEEIKNLEAGLDAYRVKFGCLEDEGGDFEGLNFEDMKPEAYSTIEFHGKSEPWDESMYSFSDNEHNDQTSEKEMMHGMGEMEHSDKKVQVLSSYNASDNPTEETGTLNKAVLTEQLCEAKDTPEADEADGLVSLKHNSDSQESSSDTTRNAA